MNSADDLVQCPLCQEADAMARERAARQDAQRQLEECQRRLAKARLDLQREMREQGWTPGWAAGG